MIINGERSLAYIAKITDIQPIPNYDRVELATINDGWRVIISKADHFIIGDWCIYFEIDSKVPEDDERFAFLAKRNFRVKTLKMCGTVSQGLVCPIVNFPEIADKTLGEDVGKILNITYYEPGDNERKGYTTRSSLDDSLKAKHRKLYNMKIVKWLLKREWGRKLLNKLFNKRKDKRGFPKFVSKTDEERCLIGDTKISTATGRIRIADIVNKDLDVEVVCVDDNGNIEKRKVVGKQKIKCNEPLYKITYPYRHGVKKTNTVVCTGDHRFYTDEGYVQVKDLSVSDSIYMLCNSYGDDCISSVYGMLMGDSSIVFDRRCDSAPRIKFTQGEKQLDYLKYKMHIFGCDNDKIFSGSSGYCKNKTYSWHQKTDPNISVNVLSDWVRNGKKKLTENVFKYVDDRFLAFLYMDDGSLRHREDGSHPGITISTNSYSEDEIKRFVETVNSRFDFEVRFGVSKGKYPEVRIVGDNVYKFLEMVSPYMCDCMKYKTLPQYEHLVGSKPIRFSKSIRYVRTSIVSISEYSGKENYVYDITVYHNHNFFANGILTHNCENMPWVLGDGNDYVLTEKLDGCLDRDVSVVTNSGIFKISEIVNKKMPVQVLSYNTESGRCEYKDIKQYFKWKRVSDMYDVVVKQMGTSGGNREKHIKCTSTHKFFNGTDYTPSCELKAGDMVFHRKETSSEVAKQIALGKLLGDASLSVKHGILNGGFSFNHSIKQKEYFDETVRLLGNDCHKYKNSTSGYGSELLRAHYVSSGDIHEDVCRKCWDGEKKTVTKEWCDCLTPISLAFWYMDDGYIHNADNDNLRPRIYIATNSFSLYECNLLIDALKNKFDIEAKLNTKESYKGNVLSLDTKNTDKFCLLVAPYICDGMKYKLPIRYRNIKYCLSDYVCENGSSIVETTVVRVNKIEDYGRKYVFDLEVEDNHNYFACGVLTHNTSSTYALERKGKRKFEFYVCSRNVRQENENQACYHEYNIYWAMAKKYNIEENLRKYLNANPDIKWVCIQGESVGKVQGNPLKLNEDDLYVFNFITSKDGRWDSRAGKQLVEEWGMKWVPILGIGKTQDNMPDMKKFSHGNSVVNPNVLREGIVYRSLDGQRSFKNVDPEYLLKHNQ